MVTSPCRLLGTFSETPLAERPVGSGLSWAAVSNLVYLSCATSRKHDLPSRAHTSQCYNSRVCPQILVRSRLSEEFAKSLIESTGATTGQMRMVGEGVDDLNSLVSASTGALQKFARCGTMSGY